MLGRDDGGPFVDSTLLGGFEQFRDVLDGVVLADLAGGLGVETVSASDGMITVRCRLDAALAIEQAVLYDPAPNLVVSQRPLGRPPGGRWPFRVPIRP